MDSTSEATVADLAFSTSGIVSREHSAIGGFFVSVQPLLPIVPSGLEDIKPGHGVADDLPCMAIKLIKEPLDYVPFLFGGIRECVEPIKDELLDVEPNASVTE